MAGGKKGLGRGAEIELICDSESEVKDARGNRCACYDQAGKENHLGAKVGAGHRLQTLAACCGGLRGLYRP